MFWVLVPQRFIIEASPVPEWRGVKLLTPKTIKHLIDGASHATGSIAIQFLPLLMVECVTMCVLTTALCRRATVTYVLYLFFMWLTYGYVFVSLTHNVSKHCSLWTRLNKPCGLFRQTPWDFIFCSGIFNIAVNFYIATHIVLFHHEALSCSQCRNPNPS